MTFHADERFAKAIGTGFAVVTLAFATGGMAVTPPQWPARMQGIEAQGAEGYTVVDRNGVALGKLAMIETDEKSRTRFISVALNDGGDIRLAAFQAYLDPPNRLVELELPADVIAKRLLDAEPATSQQS